MATEREGSALGKPKSTIRRDMDAITSTSHPHNLFPNMHMHLLHLPTGRF